ncbi:MAG: right-handed parallel beta-helix repeat-containing protein [Oligoflexia bacterium]|nr:right-handed parallel beta-helix repeat-containing protein [Oligoflexia bacterium]
MKLNRLETGQFLFCVFVLLSFVFLVSFSFRSLSQSPSCEKGEVKIGSVSYNSIQSAVNASVSGDVIELGSGEFSESVDINRRNSLTIRSGCFAELKKLRVRNSKDFALNGVSIKGGEGVSGAGLRIVNVQGGRIESGHIHNSKGSGVEVSGSKSDVLFLNLSVYNNMQGFILDNDVKAVIRGSLIYGNEKDGIYLKSVSSVIIEESDVYNNNNYGIVTHQALSTSGSFIGLSDVDLYSNRSYGLYIQTNMSFHISRSRIRDNRLSGIVISKPLSARVNKKDIVERSVIEGNEQSGIAFGSPEDLDFIDNEVLGNGYYGFSYENNASSVVKVLLRGNKIKGNEGGSVRSGVHSKDMSFYNRYLDNEDSGNETSLNSEGLGVGNHRPEAVVSKDVLFSSVGEKVSLSGKRSYDRDGKRLSYAWSVLKKPSGSSVVIEGSDKPEAFFRPDKLGDYELELEVRDGKQTSKAKVIVSSNKVRPKAEAGLDQLVNVSDEVKLDASLSSGKSKSNLSYSWSFIKKPVGSKAQLNKKKAKRVSFTADKPGDYELELEVSERGLSSRDRVLVSTLNIAPQVQISKASSPVLSSALSLQAQVLDEDLNKRGAEERKVTYKWSVLLSPSVQSEDESVYRFTDVNSKDTSFTALKPGLYLLQLVAEDGESYGVDTVLLNYGNQSPTAKTGRNIPKAITNKLVNLDASLSSDPEGKALTYEWSFDVKPQGSMSVVGDADKAQAFFKPDKAGVYRLKLKVSDGFSSSMDVMKVTVKDPKNRVPTLAKIGNKMVKIGEEMSFKLAASDKDNGASLRYMVSPLPLYENMTFNAGTGEFFFKPRAHQAGDFKLKFSVIDELGAEDTKEVTITVSPLVKGAKTSVKGRVLEANAMAISNREVVLSGIDVRLSVDGDNMHGAMTDSEGYFTIKNIPKGDEYIIQIATSAIKLNGKPKYADFHEQIEVIQGTKNVITRPFYMPLVDTNGVAEITANKALTLKNTAINAELDVPANVAMMDGMAYTGDISLSEVPKALAPIALPEELRGTATLLTLQPAGLRFTTPVRVTFPNRDNLKAGTQLDIFSVNPDTGLFEVSGKGKVNADGTKIETISGGITAATWHTPGPPPCLDCCIPSGSGSPPSPSSSENCNNLLSALRALDGLPRGGAHCPEFLPLPLPPQSGCAEPKNGDCETCEIGSNVDLLTGELREEHTLAGYRSLNEERSLTLGYSSQTASPLKVFSFNSLFLFVDDIPNHISYQIKLRGLSEGREIWTDAKSHSYNQGEEFTLSNHLDLSSFYTGIYTIEAILANHYPVSRFSTTVKKNISVINGRHSFYGKGWSVVNLHRLYPSAVGDILLVEGNGYHSQFRIRRADFSKAFDKSEPITYISPNGDYSTLKRVSKGEYERRTKEGMVYRFNSLGLLLSKEDRNGNKTSYCYYNNTSRLKCIKDPNGLEYTFTYGSDNYLDSITDPQGRVTRFEHDSEGYLIKITDPDNTTREFAYDDEGLMTAQKDKRGNFSNYIYNDYNQVTKTVRQDGSGIELIAQDLYTLPSSIGKGESESDSLDIFFRGDRRGIYTDANRNATDFTLNERGQFTSITDPLRRYTKMKRDKDGNRTKLTTPRGFVWDYTYDNMGNQLMRRQSETETETSYTYEPTFNQITSLTRPNGDKTSFEYDDKGNLLKLIKPDDTFYTFKHNRAGLMTERKDPLGNITRYFYDRRSGNLVAQRDSLGNTVNFKLDKAGNVIEMEDAKGNLIKSEYDVLNRLTKSIDAEGGESVYTYDPKGNLKSLKDGRSHITSYVYDVLDRMVQRNSPLNTQKYSHSKVEYFQYDKVGNLKAHQLSDYEYTYYFYDKANQLTHKFFGGGAHLNYVYQHNHIRYVSSRQRFNVETYSFDGDGNLAHITDTFSNPLSAKVVSELSLEYDALGRVIKTSKEGSTNQPAIVQLYEYDKNGNRVSLKAGLKGEDEESYFTNSYTYDLENQLTRLRSPAGAFDFEYDDLSRITKMTYPNNMTTEMSFEGDQRLSQVEHIKRGALFNQVQSLFKYDYDNNDNKTRMKTFRRALPVNETLNYTYDRKNQLLTATSPLLNQDDESFYLYDGTPDLLCQIFHQLF